MLLGILPQGDAFFHERAQDQVALPDQRAFLFSKFRERCLHGLDRLIFDKNTFAPVHENPRFRGTLLEGKERGVFGRSDVYYRTTKRVHGIYIPEWLKEIGFRGTTVPTFPEGPLLCSLPGRIQRATRKCHEYAGVPYPTAAGSVHAWALCVYNR